MEHLICCTTLYRHNRLIKCLGQAKIQFLVQLLIHGFSLLIFFCVLTLMCFTADFFLCRCGLINIWWVQIERHSRCERWWKVMETFGNFISMNTNLNATFEQGKREIDDEESTSSILCVCIPLHSLYFFLQKYNHLLLLFFRITIHK